MRILPRFVLIAASTLAAASADAAATVPLDTTTVEPGVDLRVIDIGPRSSTALVFIPGWGMAGEVWKDQMARLAPRHRVITFDPRGQGASSKTGYGITPEQRARDLERLLDKRGVEKAVVVAWSQAVQDLGAYILEFGTDRIAGAVLVDAAFSKGFESVITDQKRIALDLRLMNILLAAPEAFADGMIDAMTERELAPGERDDLRKMVLATAPASGVAGMLSSRLGRDRSAAAARLARPVLVLSAATSPELVSQREMAERLPCGAIEVIEGAGHAVFLDKPDLFAEKLARFLEQTGGPRERKCE